MKMVCMWLHIFQIGLILFTVVKCEVYTAITDVKKLLHTHENVIHNLKRYIEVEENKLSILKRYLKEFADEQEKANKDTQKYVENQINAFALIKRLSSDFNRLKSVASLSTEFVWDRDLLYPTEEDLIGAAAAIVRLQLIYKLNTTHLAGGKLGGIFGTPMSANDCYNLALVLYKQNYTSYATQWFEAAREISAGVSMDHIPSRHTPFNASTTSEDAIEKFRLEYQYGELCRGEINKSSANDRKLHCLYLKRSPFLKLAPIKMEEIAKNPDVSFFHDVLTDREIEIIKEIAVTRLERAAVFVLGRKAFDNDRIAKYAWLNVYNDTLEIVKQRTADFTGYDLACSEPIQVLNYGIGGHYNWHYDVGEDTFWGNIGYRMASVIYFMTDVTLGGATVFTFLNLTVTPKKGTAVFWDNILPSEIRDWRTMHAVCPVLYGNKWGS